MNLQLVATLFIAYTMRIDPTAPMTKAEHAEFTKRIRGLELLLEEWGLEL